jgi:copper chaperone CopZ
MRILALSAALLIAIATGGCDKHAAQAKSHPAASLKAESPLKPVKVMEESPHHAEGTCNQWDEEAAQVAQRKVPADAEWRTIPVTGMTCGGCERRIIASLGKVEGVLAVEADAELGQVRIATAHGNDLRSVAVDKINQLGYSAR